MTGLFYTVGTFVMIHSSRMQPTPTHPRFGTNSPCFFYSIFYDWFDCFWSRNVCCQCEEIVSIIHDRVKSSGKPAERWIYIFNLGRSCYVVCKVRLFLLSFLSRKSHDTVAAGYDPFICWFYRTEKPRGFYNFVKKKSHSNPKGGSKTSSPVRSAS